MAQLAGTVATAAPFLAQQVPLRDHPLLPPPAPAPRLRRPQAALLAPRLRPLAPRLRRQSMAWAW